ncbi:hypothetical protein DAI22_08g091100 [Oryza sativa Japonica Group]|nr:hypothetical protein DAI22_08g091100 [Oryza sativa Japonica Group]
MDGRKAAVCLIIVLVLTLGNPTSAGVCWQSNTKMPFCAGFMCKISCWISSKFTKQNVKSYRCRGSGPKGRCYCNICDKNY